MKPRLWAALRTRWRTLGCHFARTCSSTLAAAGALLDLAVTTRQVTAPASPRPGDGRPAPGLSNFCYAN
ncbi:hypothetical protein GCM10020229_10290 [Kitasatospora albolonga]